MPLSTIFLLYSGGQLYCWNKLEYPDETMHGTAASHWQTLSHNKVSWLTISKIYIKSFCCLVYLNFINRKKKKCLISDLFIISIILNNVAIPVIVICIYLLFKIIIVFFKSSFHAIKSMFSNTHTLCKRSVCKHIVLEIRVHSSCSWMEKKYYHTWSYVNFEQDATREIIDICLPATYQV